MSAQAADPSPAELSIDELAREAGLPSRTIREYQTLGLLPAPERRGRVGVYRRAHLRRLQLVARLQDRGYSLAGIRDLLDAWSGGADLTEVLGLSPDELVHLDEPGAPATREQLARALPGLVPERLDDLVAVGLVDQLGPDRFCVPSPSLLQLSVELLAAGYSPAQVMRLLGAIQRAAGEVADAAQALLAAPPPGLTGRRLDALAARGRGLLAHGTGRSAVHALGRRLGDDAPGRRVTRRSRR